MATKNLDIKSIQDLYFNMPQVLFRHQFESFNQFIDEIIYNELKNGENIFYESSGEEYIYRYGFKFDKISLKPPMYDNEDEIMYPHDARKRHMNYASKLVATVTQYQKVINIMTGEETINVVGNPENNVPIGKVFIMVKSKYCSTNIKPELVDRECEYDPGGYFIVNGNEKVVMSVERMVDNKILVFTKKDNTFVNNIMYMCQVNSRYDDINGNIQICNLKMKKDNSIILNMSQLTEIPLFILLRALGLESDSDIVDWIAYDRNDNKITNILRESLTKAVSAENIGIRNQNDALDYLATKLKRQRRYTESDEETKLAQQRLYLLKILKKDLLPHLGADLINKAYYICLMTNKLIRCFLKLDEVDDRDAYDNKRIDTPGILLGQLFKQNFKKMLNECSKFFRKKNNSDTNPINVISQIKPTIIEQGLKSALATGTWGVSKNKKGVAQSLQRLTYLQTMSYLRRVVAPSLDVASSGVTSIRHINNIQFGFLCPIQTPEGGKIGLVKSLAMMSSITLGKRSQVDIIKNIIKNSKFLENLQDINPIDMHEYTKVFLNGIWVGITKNSVEIYNLLRIKKMKNDIDKTVTLTLDYFTKNFNIYCDGGRMYRPLLKVTDNKLNISASMISDIKNDIKKSGNDKLTWNNLLVKYPDIIDYVDIESTKDAMIAMYHEDLKTNRENMNRKINYTQKENVNRYGDTTYVKYTHAEFHPQMMLGIIAGNIPFSNHNQAAKNIVNFSQAKQAKGIYSTNYKDRMDISYILWNTQRPVVTTHAMKYNNTWELPSGENAIVAIMSYTGYNQEDSLIFNQSAIDRGLFRSESLKKYHSTINKNPSTSQDDIFLKPDRNKVVGMKNANYEKLNSKGYLEEETVISNGDVIIGKVSPIQPTGNNNKVYKDNSEIFKSNVDGVIDRIHTNIYNNEGYEMYNVRVRMERTPVIGDKFSSRHGQKGTIGIVLPQKDMPFTEDGIIPDIIINPNAIPSRMTIAQLIECLGGKVGSLIGTYIDGTPFNNYDVRQLPGMLEKEGFNPLGLETMYCGITGRKLKSQIFIGPTYYMRLKHLVDDKVHSRSRGPRQSLTRQPPEGRARDGGLKIGEMEKDAMIGHGLGQFLKERMMETSDIYTTYVCDNCGLFAQKMINKDVWYCPLPECRNSSISKINVPYAFKLFIQELMSINVAPRIGTSKSTHTEII
jgi:DNA-directed RNA polymerase II subunit RPB2